MKNIFPVSRKFYQNISLALILPSLIVPTQGITQEKNNSNFSVFDSSADTPTPPAAPAEAKTLSDSPQKIETKAKTPTIVTPSSSKDTYNQTVSVNFNNVAIIEYIRFMSQLANKNFIFDDEDLQFNVTIISEDVTSVENLMAALMQELRIRDLSLIEQGNNILIHRNPKVRAPSRVVTGDLKPLSGKESEIITRVFRLNTLDPIKASEIIRPLLSDEALIEVLKDSNNLILTDLVTNINKITDLIQKLDSPSSGVSIGQYVVRNAFVDSLVTLGTQILQPIAQGNPFTLLPHPASNSIYIVSNPFIVEKGLAILQNLDLNEGKSKIYSLESLYPSNIVGPDGRLMQPLGSGLGSSVNPILGPDGLPILSSQREDFPFTDQQAPDRQSVLENSGNFNSIGRPLTKEEIETLRANAFNSPFSSSLLDGGGASGYPYDEGDSFQAGSLSSASNLLQDLPAGHIEHTIFSIYKLRYRRGDQIEIALRKIAQSLQVTGATNIDLISAINSVQWLESSNALILTGTPPILAKIRELIREVDVPLRQVFVEMLILQTTIDDSLDYGVDWGVASNGPSLFAKQSFLGDALSAAGGLVDFTTNPPTPNKFGANSGYTGFIFGKNISHNGKQYSSIAALIKALHNNTKSKILYNPKIITEDNNTATFFVGTTDRYKTQSIANDFGDVITNNFQFIDVGTKISITPLIGNNDVITLIIEQETSNGTGDANSTSNNTNDTDVNLVPVIAKSQTSTRIHMPNGFFVILSGMIQDTENRSDIRIPCLGGVPILGAVCKQKANVDIKKNLMLFIRPLIVDTEQELEDITKRQQDVYREKSKFRRDWNYEIDEALDLINIRSTDPDDIRCP